MYVRQFRINSDPNPKTDPPSNPNPNPGPKQCGAISDAAFTNYVKSLGGTPEVQAAVASRAGCDFECGNFYSRHLADAVNKKVFNELLLDASILTSIFPLILTLPFALTLDLILTGPERVVGGHKFR